MLNLWTRMMLSQRKQQLKVSGILAGTNKNQRDSMQPIEDSSIKQVPTAALVQQFASTQSTLSTVTQPSAIHPGGFCIQATSASQFTSTQSTLSDAIPQSSHNLHPGGFLMQTTTSAPSFNNEYHDESHNTSTECFHECTAFDDAYE